MSGAAHSLESLALRKTWSQFSVFQSAIPSLPRKDDKISTTAVDPNARRMIYTDESNLKLQNVLQLSSQP